MVSLEKLVVQLRQKKQEATKLRQKAEKQLKEIRSIERRSSSGLNSIDRKIESEREDVSDTSQILTRKTSQLESIERLVAAAEERLTQEKEIIEQTEQEIEFSENPEEKQNAEFRLRALNDHVQELAFEIKSRQKTAKKILDDANKYAEIKSNITSKIQKQFKSKPSLRETIVTSHKTAEKFVKELERRTKAENSTKQALEQVSVKFQEFLAKKRQAAKKALAQRIAATKKRAATKRAAALKKRAATKKKVTKKKVTKKKVTKKKVTKKKVTKKKV
ncbi:MAG: ATPase V, partial [Nitrosopumilus sp.]